MKKLRWHNENSFDERKFFNFIIENLKDSIKTWEYFVNWEKVENNLNNIKIELNILNSLIGSENFDEDFVRLVKRYPEIVKTFLPLLAVRGNSINVISDLERGDFNEKLYNFNFDGKISDEKILDYLEYMHQSKLIKLFHDNRITDFVDYVYGVEVGLDSNGRKNRGGTLMENVVEFMIIQTIKDKNHIEFMPKANLNKIKKEWGIEVKIEKSSYNFDFALLNKRTNKLFVIESNFFNDGGSKLKSVCGEFRSLSRTLKHQGIGLIWVTDGKGWITAKNQLWDAFNEIDYLINLKLIEMGYLNEIIES
ncbi:MAG: adenine methylase [Candidatus Methanomethylophilaceae archaeon]|nr:adenine methylase [Candidatus Methanomethylophilaceae archaeon]